MLARQADRIWETWGHSDPYYAVLTSDEFHRDKLTDQSRDAFFRSGEIHIQMVLQWARDHLKKSFQPTRALDFGCGVGRLVLPLSRICQSVVGVDVSPGMLSEARENCRRYGRDNVELVLSDDDLARVSGTFDFIHSVIVFQHVPPPRGLSVLRAMLGKLNPGGIAALHFTLGRKAPVFRKLIHWCKKNVPLANRVSNVLQGRPASTPLIPMYSYDLNVIADILHANGCHQTMIQWSEASGYLGAFLFFRKDPA